MSVELVQGGRVIVTGEFGVSAVCKVENVEPVQDMPGLSRVALLSYTEAGEECVFTALEIGGNWFDLVWQCLELEACNIPV